MEYLPLRPNNWFLLVGRSGQSYSEIYLENLAHARVGHDSSNSFFPFGFPNVACSRVMLGIDNNERDYGFIGSLKGFRLFSNWVSEADVATSSHSYLYWMPNLLLQIIMHSKTDLRNEVDPTVGVLVGEEV